MERREISRGLWRVVIYLPIIIGAIVFSIFNSTFFIPNELRRWSMFGAVGGMLIGWGFGLAYARYFKIKGIDY